MQISLPNLQLRTGSRGEFYVPACKNHEAISSETHLFPGFICAYPSSDQEHLGFCAGHTSCKLDLKIQVIPSIPCSLESSRAQQNLNL